MIFKLLYNNALYYKILLLYICITVIYYRIFFNSATLSATTALDNVQN